MISKTKFRNSSENGLYLMSKWIAVESILKNKPINNPQDLMVKSVLSQSA